MRGTQNRLLIVALSALAIVAGGCEPQPKPYGTETRLRLVAPVRQVWAIAPAVNLSGQRDVDPLLQADYVYQQLQEIDGVTIVPVNRVVEVFAGLRIDGVKSPEQAAQVCQLLKCDALVVPTVTAYDPYNPPKLGAALQLFQATTKTADDGGLLPGGGNVRRRQWIGPCQIARLRGGAQRSEGCDGTAGIPGKHGSVLRVCLRHARRGAAEATESTAARVNAGAAFRLRQRDGAQGGKPE